MSWPQRSFNSISAGGLGTNIRHVCEARVQSIQRYPIMNLNTLNGYL